MHLYKNEKYNSVPKYSTDNVQKYHTFMDEKGKMNKYVDKK